MKEKYEYFFKELFKIVIVIALFISCIIIFFVVMGNNYNEECFNETATIYCDNQNMTLYQISIPFTFRCREKTFDPRIQDYPGGNGYKFLEDEKVKCTIKKSLFRKYILREQ